MKENKSGLLKKYARSDCLISFSFDAFSNATEHVNMPSNVAAATKTSKIEKFLSCRFFLPRLKMLS